MHVVKIGVLEWNAAALGERQRIMLSFADYFARDGHDVTVFTTYVNDEDICTVPTIPQDIPQALGLRGGLKRNRIHVIATGNKVIREEDIPTEMRSCDFLLVPYGGYGYLQGMLPTTRVVAWVTTPEQSRPKALREIWTDSQSTWMELTTTHTWGCQAIKSRIVIPPCDFSAFRGGTYMLRREGDLIFYGEATPEKRVDLFIQAAATQRKLVGPGGRSSTICLTRGGIHPSLWRPIVEDCEVAAKEHGIELLVDATRVQVAEAFKRSRVLCLPSMVESAPLSVYEAMTAGLVIVARRIGAVVEQTGGQAFYFDEDEKFLEVVDDAVWEAGATDRKRSAEYKLAPAFDGQSARVHTLLKIALES